MTPSRPGGAIAWIVQRAAHWAPGALCERLEEEWLADLSTQADPMLRLRFALGCCWAALAVHIDVMRTSRLHALSFVAAVAVGYAAVWIWDAGYPHLAQPLHENLSAVSRDPWSAQALLRVAGMEMVSLLADALFFVAVWAVTRIHRSHPRAVLSVFVAAVTVPFLPGLARLVIHAATDPRFTVSLVALHLHLMMPVASQTLCILAAGLWVVRRPHFTGKDRLTSFAAILAASLWVVAGLAHAADLVGELSYTLHEQYLTDVLTIVSVVFLILLLWRRTSASRMPGDLSTRTGHGPGATAENPG